MTEARSRASAPKDWTPHEWENLERVNNTLTRLLAERQPSSLSNGAYVAKLRITLKTLADYYEASHV